MEGKFRPDDVLAAMVVHVLAVVAFCIPVVFKVTGGSVTDAKLTGGSVIYGEATAGCKCWGSDTIGCKCWGSDFVACVY